MKRTLLFLLIFLSTLLTAGCWNYRELNTLSIVAGIAIDKGSGTGYHLTFETADVSGGGVPTQAGAKSLLIESDGGTIFDAARNAIRISDKRLYFGACDVVIISDELARGGIAKILDWINRDAEPRATIDLYIAKGKTSKELIELKSPSNSITSFALGRIDENNSKSLSKSIFVQLYEANNILGAEGISLVLPALDSVTNYKDKTPELDGVAIFKKDRLLGFLESDESRYLALIKNEVSGGLLLVNIDSTAPNISLEIMNNDTKISTDLTGELPKIKIDISMRAALAEIETPSDLINPDGIKKIEKAASDIIETNMKQLIEKVQNEYGSDIFGFGNAIYKDNPKYWYKIKPQWDHLFQSLNVVITAKVKIQNTAELQKAIKVGE